MPFNALLRSKDFRVVSTIGLAHGSSHFFQLTLPPLFPLLTVEFGVTLAQLGFMMGIFFAVSCLTQFCSGFLVDRWGARPILFGGLFLLSVSIFAAAFAPNIYTLYTLAVFMGLGNGVFHPCDFALMNENIQEKRLGLAFAVHSLVGNIGWALAPVTSYALSEKIGWRFGLMVMGSIGLLLFFLLFSQRRLLKSEPARKKTSVPAPLSPVLSPAQSPPALLWLQRATLLCFLFMFLQAFSSGGIQSFTPSVLHNGYGLTLAFATSAVTAYLAGSTIGVLLGGIAATKTARHALIAATGLATAASCAFLMNFAIPVFGFWLLAAFFVMGFAIGLAAPSRDMIVRSVAPKGKVGRVYGFVYSGMDIGSTLGPMVFGFLLTHGWNQFFYPLIGMTLTLTIFTAINVRPASKPA